MSILILISSVLIILTILNFRFIRVEYALISAPVLVNIFAIVYVCMGTFLYFDGDYVFLNVDYNSSVINTYIVVGLFNVSFTIAFIFSSKIKKLNKNLVKISHDMGDYLAKKKRNWITLSLVFILLNGLMFAVLGGVNLGVFHNPFMLLYNGLIAIIIFSIIYNVRLSRFWGVVFVAVSIYLGFRYRLILLFLPLALYYFSTNKLSTAKFIKYSAALFVILFVVSVVGVSRVYSSGLNLELLSNFDYTKIFIQGIFNDTSTVLTTGAFIKKIGDLDLYAYLNQFYYIAIYFIPQILLENKQYSPIFEILGGITGFYQNENGSAILGYGEYFHTAGYGGVLFFGIFFGWFTAFFYGRFAFEKKIDNYNLIVYVIVISWFINSLTRGYFPQNTQDLLSLFIGIYFYKSKILSYKIKIK
jgi:hypothetical protein